MHSTALDRMNVRTVNRKLASRDVKRYWGIEA